MTNHRSKKPLGSDDRAVRSVLLSPKSSIRVGCWNVRSLSNPTKQNSWLREVLCTMSEKGIHLLALSEVRWPGHGVLHFDDYAILYSVLDTDDPNYRHRGVAVALSEKAVPAWKSAGSVCDPVSERILRLRMKSHTAYMSLIAVYAPTNEPKSAEESDAFYEELQECVRQVPRGDMLLILGDFNRYHNVAGYNW